MYKNRMVAIRKTVLAIMSVLSLAYASQSEAEKLPEVVFGTDWFEHAQNGGYDQALATGLYKKYGLKVKIDMGGPEINGQQLLVDGKYDFYMSSAIDNLIATAHGLPLVTVASIFQKSPRCIYAHKQVLTPYDLKPPYKILVSTNEIHTWWPWAMHKFNLKPSQRGAFTGSIIPFIADKKIALQGFVGTAGYDIAKAGVKYNTFWLAKYGYPEYSSTIETTESMVKNHPEIVKKFIEASLLGWKSYLVNPNPGNKLIMKANPKQTPGHLAYGVKSMVDRKLLLGPTAEKYGIGVMTSARWKKIFDLAVKNGLVPKNMDYHEAYTLRFIKNIHVKIS